MKKNSAPAADPKARVGELQRRTQDARKRAEAAKKEARDAKQRAREARRLFKEAKKVAMKARGELAALSKKLKKLIEGIPRARTSDSDSGRKKVVKDKAKAAGTPVAAAAVTKPKKSKRKDSSKHGAKLTSAKPRKSKASSATESNISELRPATPRTSRSRSKSDPVTNGSVDAVVDTARPEESPGRTSEESVRPEDQSTPEESAA